MNRWEAALERIAGLPPARRKILVWVLLGLFAGNALLAAALSSAAADEIAAHIPCGYLYWRTGTFSGGIDNFPLGQLWIALPAALFGLRYELWTEEHLFFFRLPVVALGLATCWLVYRLARSLLGEGAALAALFLAALCPDLLAHGSLATLDALATFAVTAAIFSVHRYVEAPRLGRLAILAVALAAASLVKIQAGLLYPYTALGLILAAAGRIGPRLRTGPKIWASWLLIPAVWFAATNAIYLHLPGAEGSLLPPLYQSALAGLREHSRQGHVAYLAGEYSQGGWWYFFPAAVLWKTPLGLLLPFLFALPRRWSAREILFVLLPIALFLGAAMASGINIGVRHVLPIYPFLAIVAGAGLMRAWDLAGRARAWARPAVLALVASYAFSCGTTAPRFLSYFNVLAGGSRDGHRYLLDSNFDWGTNDRFLRRHLETTGRECQIDPYAFRGTNGRILVNANALHGLLNGGERAYAWLKRFQPARQIACTWFEYDVPVGTFPERPEDETARLQVIGHLERMGGEGAAVDHPAYGMIIGRALAEARAYDLAFARLREVARRHPEYEPALALAGELATRWKLGVLTFRGREYLDGVRTPPRDARAAQDFARTVAFARRAGLAANLARAQAELGMVLAGAGDAGGAARRLEEALALDPENAAAAQLRSLLGAGG